MRLTIWLSALCLSWLSCSESQGPQELRTPGQPSVAPIVPPPGMDGCILNLPSTLPESLIAIHPVWETLARADLILSASLMTGSLPDGQSTGRFVVLTTFHGELTSDEENRFLDCHWGRPRHCEFSIQESESSSGDQPHEANQVDYLISLTWNPDLTWYSLASEPAISVTPLGGETHVAIATQTVVWNGFQNDVPVVQGGTYNAEWVSEKVSQLTTTVLAQCDALQQLLEIGAPILPALLQQVDNRNELASSSVSIIVRGGFEGLAHYNLNTVTDAVTFLASLITGERFSCGWQVRASDVGNRNRCVHAWGMYGRLLADLEPIDRFGEDYQDEISGETLEPFSSPYANLPGQILQSSSILQTQPTPTDGSQVHFVVRFDSVGAVTDYEFLQSSSDRDYDAVLETALDELVETGHPLLPNPDPLWLEEMQFGIQIRFPHDEDR